MAITLDSNFDNGNGIANGTLETPTGTVNISTVGDVNGTANWKAWFNFKLSGVIGLAPIINIEIDSLWGSRDADILPVWSDDNGVTWTRLSTSVSYDAGDISFTLPTMTEDTVQVAWDYPYSYAMMLTDWEVWAASGYASTAEALDYGTVSGSQDGRDIKHLTIEEPGHYTDRFRLAITAGVHPCEVQGRWLVKGMIDWITSGDATATELRRKCVIDFYPMVNPDGTEAGNTRAYTDGTDANRNWSQSGPDEGLEPNEVFLVHSSLHEKRLVTDFFMDIHGNYDPNPQLTEADGSGGTQTDLWSAGDKSDLLAVLANYDGEGYWQNTFEGFAADIGGFRGGQIAQYDYANVLGVEGGIYTQDDGTYPTDLERQTAGADLIRAIIENFETAVESSAVKWTGTGSVSWTGTGSVSWE